MVKLFDANGGLIYNVGIPVTGNGGFNQLSIDTYGVSEMEIHLEGSGAVTDYCFDSVFPSCFSNGTPPPPPVAACTGMIDGFDLNPQNGAPLVNLSEGIVLCAADFASHDVRIRAVSYTHLTLPTILLV